MTLLKFGDTTIVLEKVCAHVYERPRADSSGLETDQPSLRILLEGGHTVTIQGQGSISAFVTALQGLAP